MIAVVLVGTCGCTSTSNSASGPSSSPANQTLALDNLAGAINDKYKAGNYTVNTPFVMTKDGDTITYKGVITDGGNIPPLYTRNITIVLTPDRTTANTTFNSAISQAEASSYHKLASNTVNGVTIWNGDQGTSHTLSTPQVSIRLQEPARSNVLFLPGGVSLDTGPESLDVNLSNYFEISTNQYAPAST